MKTFLKNITPRKYQTDIANTCIEKNCLVVLPTGLGKTLIALIVAIKRLNDFPNQKILILAPTKPLAEQHKETFKETLSDNPWDIQLFTGMVKAEKRKKIWETANIIFSTPQCIANDLKKDLYTLKDVSFLVEDEVHRCVKNYDYAYIAKRYNKEAKNPRTLGLTASPGSDSEKIREIGINLDIKDIELRTRESSDVKPYLQPLEFEKIETRLDEDFIELRSLLKILYEQYIDILRKRNFLFGKDTKVNLLEIQKKLQGQLAQNIKSPETFIAMSACAQAVRLSHAIDLLETQALDSFSKYIEDLQRQANKKESKGITLLCQKQEFQKIRAFTLANLKKGLEHPKIKETIKIIRNEKNKNPETKIIIFTQFRDTANIITENLNKLSGINAKTFIGQAKKRGVGLSQKEQKKIIEEFKEKKINVLVATCIAEEGLDIPEVDSVIFYEPISSAIRSIQRRGRTARLSKGKLILLVTLDTRDEFAHYISRAREKKMTSQIQKIKDELTKKGTLKEKKPIQKKLFYY